MKFRIAKHSVRPDTEVVEVWDSAGNFIATVASDDAGREIRVISKHLHSVDDESHSGIVRVFLDDPKRSQ